MFTLRRFYQICAIALVGLLSLISAGKVYAKPTNGVENQVVGRVQQAEARISEDYSVQEGLTLTREESVVRDLNVEEGGLVADTAFGQVRVENSYGENFKQMKPGWFVDGHIVLEDSGDYVAGYEVLEPGKRKAEWTVSLPERVSIVENSVGGFDLLYQDPQGGALRLDSFIEPPWAINDDGEEVETAFELRGHTLVQNVEVQDKAVVTDPRLTFGRGVYLNLWGWEAEAAGRLLATLGISAGAALCTVDDKIPGALGRAAKFLCYAMPGATFANFKKIVLAPAERKRNGCYQRRLTGNSKWVEVRAKGNCEA